MNQNNITIAIDAMGGDISPYKCLKGAEIFTNKIHNIKLILLGDRNIIEQNIEKNKIPTRAHRPTIRSLFLMFLLSK